MTASALIWIIVAIGGWIYYWTQTRPVWIVEVFYPEDREWFDFARADGSAVEFRSEESAAVIARRLYPARVIRVDIPRAFDSRSLRRERRERTWEN